MEGEFLEKTKSLMYRNIILDSHLIVYRITDCRIEVLDIIHAGFQHEPYQAYEKDKDKQSYNNAFMGRRPFILE